MTLQSSGSMTGADIRGELRQTGGNLVFPDPTTRFLANKASGSLVIPTDFYSKAAVKMVHQEQLSGSSTTYVTTCNLGVDFPGRRLVICISAQRGTPGALLTMVTPTLNGVTLFAGPGQAWFNPNYSVNSGILIDTPSGVGGTSAVLSVVYDSTVIRFGVVVYSVANIGNTLSTNQGGGQPLTSTSATVSIDTNGVVIASALKTLCPAPGAVDLTFVNKQTDFEIGNDIRFSTGFINRLSPQGGQSVGMAGTGSAGICTIAVTSFGS